jgi:hypothetical protein
VVREHAGDRRVALPHHRGRPRFEDAGLLAGDRLARLAEHLGVIEPDRRDRGDERRDHVRRVQPPPSPVSTIATSAPARAKCSKASAVVTSKNVAPTRSAAGVHRATKATTSSSPIGRPATTMRSRKSTRCGDV